jgi:hypothetical protein
MHIHVYAANLFLSVKHVFQQVLGHIPNIYKAPYLPDFHLHNFCFSLTGLVVNVAVIIIFVILLLLFHPIDHYKMIMDM